MPGPTASRPDRMTRQFRDISCWHVNDKLLSFLADFSEAKTGELFLKRIKHAMTLIPVQNFVCLFIPPMSHNSMGLTQEYLQ